MIRLRRRRGEEGNAIIVVLTLSIVILALLAILSQEMLSDNNPSARAIKVSTSFQAAEAMIDDYTAKLTSDHFYFHHFTHPAESTRTRPDGTKVDAGQAWNEDDVTWTYEDGEDNWRPLGNGWEYNVQVNPPNPGSKQVTIVTTGRQISDHTKQRAIEAVIRPASIADFFRLVNGNISWGVGANTFGKLYAGVNSSGVGQNIDHAGTAYANVYAEGQITQHPTYANGAQGFDSDSDPNIRTQIRSPISFAGFFDDIIVLQQAAQNGGIYKNDPTAHGWRFTFIANGTVRIDRCMQTSGNPFQQTAPTCTFDSTVPVPTNGAMYTPQHAIVSGVLNGRVTLGAGTTATSPPQGDIIIGDHGSYVQAGDDVLGLIAVDEVWFAKWSPTTLNFRAAILAQGDTWATHDSSGSHDVLNFTGATATLRGGGLTMFDVRNYSYDTDLLYLPPPYFPILEEAYTVASFRELTP